MYASRSNLPIAGIRTRLWIFAIALLVVLTFDCPIATAAQSDADKAIGKVLDPSGLPICGAHVQFETVSGVRVTGVTGSDGGFAIALPMSGAYTARVEAAGFEPMVREIDSSAMGASLTLRLQQVSAVAQEVLVSADIGEIDLSSPDPSQKVLVREELLDANPGRPGAPVSIPGLPSETASGGIKAPQYFAPGVAGDHGAPIAQYIAVGSYLVSNNLSANAHGNGYADPNVLISAAVGSVQTDGGAFNVLEGNHALNLAAIFTLRPQLRRFVTLTGDNRDLDLTTGFSSSGSLKPKWLAIEANYGNGLMKTLEHRQQYKWNAARIFSPGNHEISLLSIGYWGRSHEGNLVPLGLGVQVNDTIDPRQQDQSHSGILAASDRWKTGIKDELNFSGFFRTFNLALFSNFGEGLIRQSEFRTVEGAEVRECHTFTSWLEGMAGLDYDEDDIHRDNLDHYLSADQRVFGAYLKVLANNIDIRDVTPFVALRGNLGKHLRIYVGMRHDQIEIKNTDLIKPGGSFDEWKGFEIPKATLSWAPGAGSAHWLPSASFSIGQAFFTQDPRIGTANSSATVPATHASPFERSHSEQLAIEKQFSGTDLRVTLGHTTTTATLAKIDADTGLAQDEGSGTLKFLTVSARHQFTFATLQAVFSKADARDDSTGIPTPEAPRTIFDALATLDRLPMGLHGRGEYEYVGHKLLDVGGFEGVPVGETRMALVRPFLDGRLELGANGMLARGYTGQTVENFAPDWQAGGPPPACAPGVNGIANNFDCGTVERSVGIRMVSWVGGSISWRFHSER